MSMESTFFMDSLKHMSAKPKSKTKYLRVIGSTRIITIYTDVVDRNLVYGVAFKKQGDSFIKRVGRITAYNDFVNNPKTVVGLSHTHVVRVLDHLVQSGTKIPKWVTGFCNRYLAQQQMLDNIVHYAKNYPSSDAKKQVVHELETFVKDVISVEHSRIMNNLIEQFSMVHECHAVKENACDACMDNQ